MKNEHFCVQKNRKTANLKRIEYEKKPTHVQDYVLFSKHILFLDDDNGYV